MQIDSTIQAVLNDAAFIDSLNRDPEINALEKERVNPVDELAALCQVLGGRYRITNSDTKRSWWRRQKDKMLVLHPITPAVWSLWWSLNLPFTRGDYASELDCDIALYTLSRSVKDIAGDVEFIAGSASGYCRKYGFAWQDISEAINMLAHDALRPLEMLPPVAHCDGAPEFGADWLTRICGTVAQRFDSSSAARSICRQGCLVRQSGKSSRRTARQLPAKDAGKVWKGA